MLELRPDASAHPGQWDVGVVGPTGDPDEPWEVRAFFGPAAALREDPVTGSLNAAAAQWLLGTGRARARPGQRDRGPRLSWLLPNGSFPSHQTSISAVLSHAR